jgi:hypothetical protein
MIEGGLQFFDAEIYPVDGDSLMTSFEKWVPLYSSGEQVFRVEMK